MTTTTNARVAGFAFLLYIAVGLSSLGRAPGPLFDVVASLVMCFCAFTLAVTLFGITSAIDREIALMGMVCRVAEGIAGIVFLSPSLAMKSAMQSGNDPNAAAFEAVNSLLKGAERMNFSVGGMLFAVGSTMFCWLLVRGRLIPAALAWLGLFASVLLVIALPLQLGHVLTGGYTMLVWLPMAAFEIPTGGWLVVRGGRRINHQSPIGNRQSGIGNL